MSQGTAIEWTHRPGTKGETWNVTTGCNKVSAGCKNCYAERMHKRQLVLNPQKYKQPFLEGAVPYYSALGTPFKWRKPRTVFVNSMSDLFHEGVDFEFLTIVFDVMRQCPQHTFLLLTKRPERMAEYLQTVQVVKPGQPRPAIWRESIVAENWPLPNVWLGTSVEDQQSANDRIPHLLKCPAAIRFLSCEPLLGALDPWAAPTAPADWMTGIDWVIAGGESGPGARPMHPEWVRALRDQCAAAGAAFFFKQWGAWVNDVEALSNNTPACQIKTSGETMYYPSKGDSADRFITEQFMFKVGKKAAGRMLDGVAHNAWPEGAASYQPIASSASTRGNTSK